MKSAAGKVGEEAAGQHARRRIIGLAARATTAELETALERIGRPDFADVRRPEIGLVMLRGRMGGDGSAFNLGEATVSRAAVRLQTGEIGHSYSLGRDPARARLAALIDALWQRGEHQRIETEFARPVAARLAAERQARAAETAATRVDFFTLVRGED
jgi:alpha-D-ribose 1-methylphosphonate 5-triphosphate synthase subunit PhnG